MHRSNTSSGSFARLLALVAATALAGATVATDAAAADRYVLEPVEETPAEFGTGWYIRGDVGIVANGVRNTSVDRRETNDPQAPFEGRESDTDASFSLGAAVGYRFTHKIRGDISYDYVARHDEGSRTFTLCQGERFYYANAFPEPGLIDCFREDQSEHTINLLQANAYFEFAPERTFSPFLGLGFGVARIQYDVADARYTCNPNDDTIFTERCLFGEYGEAAVAVGAESTGATYHLAGSLIGGVSFRMSKNLTLDSEYRYTRVATDPLFGGEQGHDDFSGHLHQVKFGLRYEIW